MPPHDVFISHSSVDLAMARRVCAALEGAGLTCWMAKRDIPPGAVFASAINAAIQRSRVMVVLVTQKSLASPHVLREVDRAVHHRVALVPVRLADIELSGKFEYLLATTQWFDLFPGASDVMLSSLVDCVCGIAKKPRQVVLLQPFDATPTVRPPRWAGALRRWRWPIAVACVAAIVALGLVASSWRSDRVRVRITKPLEGESILGSVPAAWTVDGHGDVSGFEIEIAANGKSRPIEQATRNAHMMSADSGQNRLRVRPMFGRGKREAGNWSEWRHFTHYVDTLDRIYHTRELHVGHAESDEIFITGSGTTLSGFDIELVTEAVQNILERHQKGARLVPVFHEAKWSDKNGKGVFLGLLEFDRRVDLLASGVSITEERKAQRLLFTDPVVQFRQTIVTLGSAPAFVHGRLAANVKLVAAVPNTTNLALALELQKAHPGIKVVDTFTSSVAYDEMLKAVAETQSIDACILDKPYADLHIKRSAWEGKVALADVVSVGDRPVKPERIGFVLRKADDRLAKELNGEIRTLRDRRRELTAKYMKSLDPLTAVP